MEVRNDHYCQHCKNTFKIKIHECEEGDAFILCPFCNHKHYRFFKGGIAIHGDINMRHYKDQPFTIRGTI